MARFAHTHVLLGPRAGTLDKSARHSQREAPGVADVQRGKALLCVLLQEPELRKRASEVMQAASFHAACVRHVSPGSTCVQQAGSHAGRCGFARLLTLTISLHKSSRNWTRGSLWKLLGSSSGARPSLAAASRRSLTRASCKGEWV